MADGRTLPPGVRIPSALGRLDPAAPGPDDEALREDIATLWPLPKVELHLHLEGAMRPETVRALAQRREPASSFAAADWPRGYWSFHDLASFIVQLGPVVRTCARTDEDYYRIARECFEDLAAQHVIYAEINFGPRPPGRSPPLPIADQIAAMDQARREVEARTSLHVGFMLGLSRDHVDPDPGIVTEVACQWVRDAALARERGAAVVGIDLHGDEQTRPSVAPFVPAFRLAAEAGLGRRAHAGEGSGAANLRESLRDLRVQRIAHGVRAIEDPSLVRELAASGVALDVCPTSNVLLSATPSLQTHPIRALQEAGVAVTVSSDDPLPFETTITTELALLHRYRAFSLAELGQMTLLALDRSFAPEATRAAFRPSVSSAWADLYP
jgi:adenosine deaminase